MFNKPALLTVRVDDNNSSRVRGVCLTEGWIDEDESVFSLWQFLVKSKPFFFERLKFGRNNFVKILIGKDIRALRALLLLEKFVRKLFWEEKASNWCRT